MKVLIIGGTGFLGRTLSAELQVLGHDVSITGTSRDAEVKNYRSFDATRDEIEIEESTDAVFYLSQSSFYREFPEHSDHLFSVNSLAPLNVARAAAEKGVKYFCFASTGNVYQPSFRALREDDPVHTGNAYALSKVMGEQALALLNVDIKIMCVRIFGLFGPGQRSMLPMVLYQRVKEGQKIVLEPSAVDASDQDGLKLSFVFCPDAAKILASLAEMAVAEENLPKLLNLAGPEAISVKKFASEIGRCLDLDVDFECSERARQFDLIADISRLRGLLNPAFTPFEEAMGQTYTLSP